MKTLSVLGLNASKCMRFQTKKHLVWTRLFLTKIWSQKPQETPPLSPSIVIASESIQEQQNYLFPEGPASYQELPRAIMALGIAKYGW